MNYQDVKKDLVDLYCLTKNKHVEDVFIKYAEDLNESFLSWLKSANISALSVSQQTIQGLGFLIRIREKFPSSVSFSNLASHFANNPSDTNGFIYAKAFCDIMNDTRCSEILGFFSDILIAIKPMSLLDKDKKQVDTVIDNEMLANDLKKINDEFHKDSSLGNDLYEDISEKIHTSKETKKERTEKLFTFLLHEFTKEIHSALISIGATEKANAIKNWAIANPVEIIKYFSPQKKISSMGDDAVYVVKTIMKTIKENTPEDQFNFIRNRAMLHGKVMSEQDYKNYYLNKIKNMDLSRFTGMPSSEIQDARVKLSANQLSNPDAIVFIALVLYGIYEKVK